MTREEAIICLERRTTIPGDGFSFDDINRAIDMAIRAIEYRIAQSPPPRRGRAHRSLRQLRQRRIPDQLGRQPQRLLRPVWPEDRLERGGKKMTVGIICDLLFTALPVVLFLAMIIAGKLLPDKLDDEDDGYDEYEDFWWTCP